MILKIPLTGTLLTYDPPSGDPDDSVRIIDLDLGHVRWHLVDLDLDNDVALIEVSPVENIAEDTGEKDEHGNPVQRIREATLEERQSFLSHAYDLVADKTKEELYKKSGSPKLKKPKRQRF